MKPRNYRKIMFSFLLIFGVFFLTGATLVLAQNNIPDKPSSAETAANVSNTMVATTNIPAPVGLLDNKTFVGQIGEKGTEITEEDTFLFENGKFRSTGCDSYGFNEAPYSAVTDGSTIIFEAETTSDTDGKILWKGTLTADTLEGTFSWYKPDAPAPKEHWFKTQASK